MKNNTRQDTGEMTRTETCCVHYTSSYLMMMMTMSVKQSAGEDEKQNRNWVLSVPTVTVDYYSLKFESSSSSLMVSWNVHIKEGGKEPLESNIKRNPNNSRHGMDDENSHQSQTELKSCFFSTAAANSNSNMNSSLLNGGRITQSL